MGKGGARSAREHIRAQREEEQRRAQREEEQRRAQWRKTVAILVGASLFLVLAVGGGYWYMSRAGQGSDFDGELAEQTVQDDGSVVMARPDAQAPVVEVYADFQCPVCADFEEINAGTLNELAAEGEAVVHFRPVSIFALQPSPVSDNSLRAAAAARAAADYGVYVPYADLLWHAQPREGREGFAPGELLDFAEEAGITGDDLEDFAARVDAESAAVEEFTEYAAELTTVAQEALTDDELASMTGGEVLDWGEDQGVDPPDLDGTYVRQVVDATSAAHERYPQGADAFTGTPAVYVDGTQLDLSTQAMTTDGLREAVAAAEPGEVDTAPADERA
jgi:protein-disulfide isomerase